MRYGYKIYNQDLTNIPRVIITLTINVFNASKVIIIYIPN